MPNPIRITTAERDYLVRFAERNYRFPEEEDTAARNANLAANFLWDLEPDDTNDRWVSADTIDDDILDMVEFDPADLPPELRRGLLQLVQDAGDAYVDGSRPGLETRGFARLELSIQGVEAGQIGSLAQSARRFEDSAPTPFEHLLRALDPAVSFDECMANLWVAGFSFTDEEITALQVLTPLLGEGAIQDELDEFLNEFSEWTRFPLGVAYTELADGQRIVLPSVETLRALRGLVELVVATLDYQRSDSATLEVFARLDLILPSDEELMAIEASVTARLLSESRAQANKDRGVTLAPGEVRFLQGVLEDISADRRAQFPTGIQRTLMRIQILLGAHPDGTPLTIQGPATVIGSTGVQIGSNVEVGGDTIHPLYVAISAALAYTEDISFSPHRERLEAVRAGLEALLGGEQLAGRAELDQALRSPRESTRSEHSGSGLTDVPVFGDADIFDGALDEEERIRAAEQAGLVATDRELMEMLEVMWQLVDGTAIDAGSSLEEAAMTLHEWFHDDQSTLQARTEDGLAEVLAPRSSEDLIALWRVVSTIWIAIELSPNSFSSYPEAVRVVTRLDPILRVVEALDRDLKESFAPNRAEANSPALAVDFRFGEGSGNFLGFQDLFKPDAILDPSLSNSGNGEPSASAVGTIWTGLQTFWPEASGEIRLEPDGNAMRLVRTAPAAKPANNPYGHLVYQLSPEALESRLQVAQEQGVAPGDIDALRNRLMQLVSATDADDATSRTVLQQLLSGNREDWRAGFAVLASRSEANEAPIGTPGAYGATAMGARLQLWTSRGAPAVPVGR